MDDLLGFEGDNKCKQQKKTRIKKEKKPNQSKDGATIFNVTDRD